MGGFNIYCCGTCKFSKYSGKIYDYVCTNEDSEYYGLSIAYQDSCDEQEEKD